MGAGFAAIRVEAVGRHGAIILGVVALHIAAILALLIVRLAPERVVESRTEITYIPLPPIVARPPKQRYRPRNPATITLPDYHWVLPLPGINVGPGAITVAPIGKLKFPRASADQLRPSCPKVLRLDSPAWKRCMAPTPQEAQEEKDGWKEFEVPRSESIYAERWKAEKKARETPYREPCAYTKSFGDPNFGGKQENAVMADVGCAVGKLFGR